MENRRHISVVALPIPKCCWDPKTSEDGCLRRKMHFERWINWTKSQNNFLLCWLDSKYGE